MKTARLSFLMIVTGFTAISAFGEAPAFEVMCRQKAKEVAAETYRGCITDNRKVQIEQLRNDYQQKLKSLKDEYEGEIKKMSGASASRTSSMANSASGNAVATSITPSKKSGRATRSSSALRSLPSKTREVEDLTVRLHSASHDDSTMDIPEPVPVENVQTDSDSGV